MMKVGEDLVGLMKLLVMFPALVIKASCHLIGSIFLTKITIRGFGVTKYIVIS